MSLRSHSKPFFGDSNRGRIDRLIGELHGINFDSTSIEMSKELTNKFKESTSIISAWRDHYKIPLTDERYLNATHEEIYEDYLLIKLRELRDFFDERVPNKQGSTAQITQEEFDRMNEEDVMAIKMCRENYCTEEELRQYEKESQEKLNKKMLDDKMMTEEGRLEIIQSKLIEMHEQRTNGLGK